MASGYLKLKIAWELFQQAPDMLSGQNLERLLDITRKQEAIEAQILSSDEAAMVIVPAATVANRIAEIRRRFVSTDDLNQNMQRSELDQDSLAAAIERDLRVEAILEKVAANLEAVTSIDAEIYYRLHPEAFNSPEARHLQHILITFDNDHQKTKALLQLELLRTSLNSIESFGAAALRHSQCPTAVNAGDLGIVKRKQLYVELETAAFALSPGEISEVLESPIGLHIIRCEKIHAGGIIPFADVREKIIERLTDKRRQEAQKNWIKSLASQKQKTSTLLTT